MIPDEKKIPVPVSMLPSLRDRAEMQAAHESIKSNKSVSRSEIICRAVELYLSMQLYDSLADWCRAQTTKE